MRLVGRHAELTTIEQLLGQAQAGNSAVLTVRGEAGIGKTEVLRHARDVAEASGLQVSSAVGSESETQFAFAGLHQLCVPLLGRTRSLPAPQRTALGVVFGLEDGAAPDRFLVGMAILNLLAEAAEDTPLLCLVDDAQWLDQASAQVLAFVARRMQAERVVLLFAVRDPGGGDAQPFVGLPEMRLAGLSNRDARQLMSAAIHASVDDGVRDRILAEARGNPLALMELPGSVQPAALAGGFATPHALDIPRRLEESFWRRSKSLPAETQLLLLAAAAEPTGEPSLLWRAVTHLGIAREAVAPAEDAGLLELDARVRFRHPLVRSAIYTAAGAADRRRVHDALAAATDPQIDPDRHAWHRAQSVLSTDEQAAMQLEHAAGRAQARGGVAAAAAFLQRAAELTPEQGDRARRAVRAAALKQEAGAWDSSLQLLAVAESMPLDPLQDAQVKLVRAQIAFHQSLGREVPGVMLEAATALAPLDAGMARAAYLHALNAAIIIGPQEGRGFREIAEAALAAPAAPLPPRPLDLLLDGLALTYTQGIESGVPALRRALEAFRAEVSRAESVNVSESQLWWLASRTALVLFDDDLVDVLTSRNVRLARDSGAIFALPAALLIRSMTLVLAGDFSQADELAAEQAAITQAIGGTPLRLDRLMLAAWRGREAETAALHADIMEQTTGRAGGTEAMLANYILSVLHNGLGDYPAALNAAAQACESRELGHSSMALPELVEAASRAEDRERAMDALDQLDERARAMGTEWALGLTARSRALTSTGPGSEEHYREAIARLGHCRMTAHLARTHLVYGEWLRREERRKDAREQLRTAHQMLSDMGAEAFAARAARELRATGERPRQRTAHPIDALTAQELQIARQVATGATSREVATHLFLSPRTVEAHLRSIFRKLDISSRRQLRLVL